ncbi:hypothetical protein H4217_000832 [Coemansia sp. RSA 1939]|nr:hypothetical protein H4217_000832 [Coemansia sp. RSA 1939]KAJ2599634.1 hypothetical protein EV177_007290 [Coemansia sp. RSA 1804]KAJ2666505.1 hypothetical protein GGH99_006746 [Coemansia sp. RSA 1285]
MSHVAIVTGASKGIGLAIAKEFLNRGVSVIGVARSHDILASLQAELAKDYTNSLFIPCTADVATSEGIGNVAQCLEKSKLELCALVNNADLIEPIAKVANISIAQWRRLFEVNVTLVVALTQRLMPELRKNKACVVNVSSGAAAISLHGWSAYCSSKAALNMLTMTMAIEEPDIAMLAIGPGTADTEMHHVIRNSKKGAMNPDDQEMLKQLYLAGKLLRPEVPANAIVKLALRAPKEISGRFYPWDAPEIAEYLE